MDTAAPAKGEDSRPKARILVVDDSRVNQEVTRLQLRQLGYTPDLASNGQAALEAHRQHEYDLIFMDCSMPEMDGLQAAWTIRQQEQEAAETSAQVHRTHIVAMTANTDADIRQRCAEAGMDDYISKPVQLSELQAALERVLFAGTQPTEHDVIDFKVVARLRLLREPDQPDPVAHFTSLFLEDAPRQLAAIEQAIGRNDLSSMADTLVAANNLKGSAANLGAIRLAGLCDEIDKNARSGFLSETVPLVKTAREELARVQAALVNFTG